ncbi:hypothetical protein KOY_05283 [Bacillus cereus VDM021]|nr:hypothetical protein KOY_05283 [Bacillus cereus VDM021]
MRFVEFEVLKHHKSPQVAFYDMNHSCLIAIPSWNWSFLMDYAMDFKEERPLLIQALSKHVSDHDAESITDAFYNFVFSEFN